MINQGYNSTGYSAPRSEQMPNQAYPTSPLLGAFLARLPYASAILQSILSRNEKFDTFKEVASRGDLAIQEQSLFLQDPNIHDATLGGITINKDYQAFIYATIDKDKGRRVMDYRRMTAYAELADSLDEICDECIVKDENDKIVQFAVRGDYTKEAKDAVQKEFDRFIRIFDLENKGWEYFRQFLIDGEIFFENIIKEDKKNLGIIGIVNIPSEVINPVYHNVQNEVISGYILRKPTVQLINSMTQKDAEEIIMLNKAQITYVHSGIWNEFKSIRLPYIENAKRAYRQLSLIEDSIVIYRLVRAPERLVFKVYTGNMPPPKAEAHIKRLMQRYWSRKNYDQQQGGVTNVYDPQSMLDSYFFPVDAQGKSTEVSSLQAGNITGEITDLSYFLKKLYKSLKIPNSRMMAEDGGAFRDGSEITRDELRFARFIIRIQRQFAVGIRDAFITHLKLRNYWKQYNLKEHAISIKFNVPTSFMAMRDQQLLETKFTNYNNAISTNTIAQSYAQKYYLGFSDSLMKENREWLRKDAALKWELAQIESTGPNFRELLTSQQGTTGEAGGEMNIAGGMGGAAGGGPPGAAGGEGEELPPAFGPGEAPTGAEATPAAGGAAAAPAGPTPPETVPA